jgi:uncharacterized protein (TIGR00297 family)
MLFLYFLVFILIGIFLNLLRGYDLFTISLIYVVFSIFLYFVNIYAVIYVIIFFAMAEGITLLFNKRHEKRNYYNIVGNCSAAVIFLILGFVIDKLQILDFSLFVLASIVSINAAFADTFSSEIGRLSKIKPRLITTFKRVERGTEGAITFLGIVAATFASFVSVAYFYFLGYTHTFLIVLFIGGILGSVIDSFIGAAIERKGIFNNNQTNFLATFLAGWLAILIYVLIV